METAGEHRLLARQLGVNVTAFANGGMYSIWIIVYILLIMWMVSWFCEFVYGLLAAGRKAAEGGQKPGERRSDWGERFANSVRLLRDGLFLLLGSIMINQSSFGITRSVLALTWTIFALFIVWSFAKLFTTSKIVDFVFWWPVAGLLIAVFALAWNASS